MFLSHPGSGEIRRTEYRESASVVYKGFQRRSSTEPDLFFAGIGDGIKSNYNCFKKVKKL
jgi:hypothetical protein